MANDIKMRKSMLGGFKRKDVVNYVEAVNAQNDLTVQELKRRISELEDDREIRAEGMMDALVADAVEQNKVLSSKVTELSRRLEEANATIDAYRDTVRKLENEKEYAFSTVASTQAELIRIKKLTEENAAVAMKKDGEIYGTDELLQEIRSYRMIASALRENSRKLMESLSKQLDFADTCIASLTKGREQNK